MLFFFPMLNHMMQRVNKSENKSEHKVDRVHKGSKNVESSVAAIEIRIFRLSRELKSP